MPEQTAPATATILENVMSKYTAEQVAREADLQEDPIADMLRAFATHLRERESAITRCPEARDGGVRDE